MRVEDGAHLDALLGPTVAAIDDPRDAALLTRLVYGVATWRLRLDWTLAAFASRPLDDFEPAVRTALRLGLLQLWLLDRIPPHAAVDTSVEAAKAISPGGARVVNAILRRAIRDGERPPPTQSDDPAGHLAITLSHPQWLVELWIEQFGASRTRTLLEANNQPGPSSFRVDLRRTTRDAILATIAARGIPARADPFTPTAITIDGPVSALTDIEGIDAQGVASQIVARLVAPEENERILDLCAAPGGKASALAEVLEHGLVVASDRARAGVARSGARRTGRPVLGVVRADGTHPPYAAGAFDAVLVDAPCSGLGTLRAHPELRWRRGPGDVSRLARLQQALLDAAATLVRPGGRLIYATCTLVREENEDNVSRFLDDHRSWSQIDPRPRLAAAARFVGDDLALRTAPDDGGLDGFFAVTLRNDTRRV